MKSFLITSGDDRRSGKRLLPDPVSSMELVIAMHVNLLRVEITIV